MIYLFVELDPVKNRVKYSTGTSTGSGFVFNRVGTDPVSGLLDFLKQLFFVVDGGNSHCFNPRRAVQRGPCRHAAGSLLPVLHQ
jgi:hypothetical protein